MSANRKPLNRPGKPALPRRHAAPGFDLVLASGSPRRRELLARAGLAFRVVVPDIDETPRPGELPAAFARRAALDKALAVADRLGPARRARAAIGCDTIVVLGRRILGKPCDAAAARRMLRALSGRTHQVMSGVAVVLDTPGRPRRCRARTIATDVVFRRLAPAEIEAYIESGDPMDKAGAYGIQEGAAHMVRGIRGSYTNVVGLPMAELLALLTAGTRGPDVRTIVRGGPAGLVPVGSEDGAGQPESGRPLAARARKPRRSPA